MRTRSIRSPADRDRLMTCNVSRALDGAGDGAAAGEKRLGQLADGLLRRVADGEVAEQPADHGGEGVAAGVEPAHVVGEGDLGVGRHAHKVHGYRR